MRRPFGTEPGDGYCIVYAVLNAVYRILVHYQYVLYSMYCFRTIPCYASYIYYIVYSICSSTFIRPRWKKNRGNRGALRFDAEHGGANLWNTATCKLCLSMWFLVCVVFFRKGVTAFLKVCSQRQRSLVRCRRRWWRRGQGNGIDTRVDSSSTHTETDSQGAFPSACGSHLGSPPSQYCCL